MDINPLIADLKEYEEELEDSISIAIGFNELELADRYVAHDIAEIKGELHSNTPFHQVAELYRLPVDEVIQNIRDFTSKGFKKMLIGDQSSIKDIDFKDNVEGKE